MIHHRAWPLVFNLGHLPEEGNNSRLLQAQPLLYENPQFRYVGRMRVRCRTGDLKRKTGGTPGLVHGSGQPSWRRIRARPLSVMTRSPVAFLAI